MKLFDNYVPEITNPKRVVTKVVKKRKGTITISMNNNPTLPFGVDFNGYQEGSGSPCKDEAEVQAVVERLKQEKSNYDLKVVDERNESVRFAYLDEYRDYILKLCEERGQECEIWYDTSVPMDCEIALRMKHHNCYHSCIAFRFTKGILEAYDGSVMSDMGGTHFVDKLHQNHIDRLNIIKEIMERVFNNECCKQNEKPFPDKRIHNIINGWKDRSNPFNNSKSEYY